MLRAVALLLEDLAADLWRERASSGPAVHVFAEDPDLVATADPRVADHLRSIAVARRLTLQRGAWDAPAELDGGLGVLVLDGLLMQTFTLDDRCSPHLLGPGDLLRPGDQHDPGALFALESCWEALSVTEVAVLDARFAQVVGGHPPVLSALVGRSVRTSRHLALQLAIVHIPRAEHRMLLLLWHLADRFGRMRGDGVHLPFALTHRLLAELACVQRPTATNALAALVHSRQISRCSDGTWLLHGDPPAGLGG